MASGRSVVVSGQPDLRAWHELTDAERAAYDLGNAAGLERGIAAGWQAADEHADRVHRAAFRVMQTMANYDSFEVSELKRENRDLRRLLERAAKPPAPVDRLDLLPLHESIKRENRVLQGRVEDLERQLALANARTGTHQRQGAVA